MDNNDLDIRYSLRKKLQSRQPVFAGWTSLAHPSITEMFCRTGFNFIGIDIEHSTISQEQSQRIIAACHANGINCLPRIASHNGEMIKRLLDSGADGIIVPMVSTPGEVEQIIDWCYYPPDGKRSFGIARAQGYGFDFDQYVQQWNSSCSVIIQIESVQGVENIDELLAYDQIQGAMVGPYDLSGSLGVPGELNHSLVIEASKKVVEACSRHGKACGTQIIEPNEKNIQLAFDSGFTFTVLASDIFALWKWSENTARLISRFRK